MPCNAFFIQAYAEQYGLDSDMSSYFLSPYAELIQNGLLKGEYSGTEVNQSLPSIPIEFYNEDFINSIRNGNAEWVEILSENSIHEWDISVPALITHNEVDNVSPPFNSAQSVSYTHLTLPTTPYV